MAELETIVIETSLLSSQTGRSNEEDSSSKPSIDCLSIISRMKLTIHDSLVQETGTSLVRYSVLWRQFWELEKSHLASSVKVINLILISDWGRWTRRVKAGDANFDR